MKIPRIGGHVSTAGGFNKCIENAKNIGAECIQIFAGSPRRYEVASLSVEELKEYKEGIERERIFPVYIHANYLLNLASEDKNILNNSLKSIKKTLEFAKKIKGDGVVYHPGSPKGGSKREAINREIKSITEVLKDTPQDTFLLIENTAGVKKIGTDPYEIGYIFNKINSRRMKVCIDTAHSFESGNIKNFEAEEIQKWLSLWKNEVGIENISLLHINDSLTKGGSQHDRHANIGEGFIGLNGFNNLIKLEEFKKIPWILEVPGFDNNGPDKKNIDLLKSLRQ